MGAAREATNLKMQRDKQFSYEFSGHIPPHSKNEGSHADIEAKPFADQKVDHHHDTCCTKEISEQSPCFRHSTIIAVNLT